MKHKLYKNAITLFAIGIIGTAFGQKFDKKYSENFKTNKDVEVAINASNTDINVTTWNKNEVQIDAFIEVEGVTKEEAEKYFKNWNFEALGNSKTVKITAKGNNRFNFKNDFVFFDNMDFDITIPEINIEDIKAIRIPDMNFDFDFDFNFDELKILEDLEDIDKMVSRDGKYEFTWKDGKHNIKITSKEEWEAFKKTKEYKELKEKMQINKEKVRKEFAESKEQMRKELQESRKKMVVDREKIREELQKAREELKKVKLNYNSEDVIINGKKVKIKKRLEIKVPKEATFDLNTRHCKVKLPNTVAFGNVKYGTFNANNLQDSKLTIDYSPVTINDLNACTLFLNNVTDAKIASVTNTLLNTNSSGLVINSLGDKVNLQSRFGDLLINSLHPDLIVFDLDLSQSDATIKAADFLVNNLNINMNTNKNSGNDFFKKITNGLQLNGNFNVSTKNNKMNVIGSYSKLVLLK